MQPKNKTKPSRKEKQRAKTKACFNCKEKGYLIAVCPVLQNETRSDPTGQTGHPRPVGAQIAQPHSYNNKQVVDSKVMPKLKRVQSSKDVVESRKAKHCTCYTCREKGHLGKDCPKDNPQISNLVHYDFTKLRKDQAGTCAIRVIKSPRTSIRAIWVPKHLLTNLDEPNKVWIPKSTC
jgi:hypothetical protein